MEVTCKATVICDACHTRNVLERERFTDGETIRIICGGCEIPLQTEFRKPVDINPEPEYSLSRNSAFRDLFNL
jgi:hypothetical protein